MLSAVLLWLMFAGLLVLPVLLRWAGDEPRNEEDPEDGDRDEDRAEITAIAA